MARDIAYDAIQALSYTIQKLRAITSFAVDGVSAAAFLPHAMSVLPKNAPHVMIRKGFGAPDILYAARALFYAKLGVRPYIPQLGWITPKNYLRSNEEFARDFEQYRRAHGPFRGRLILEGHSIGALEQLLLFTRYPEDVGAVFSIAGFLCPANQWPIVSFGEKMGIPLPEPVYRATTDGLFTKLHDPKLLQKIVVIAAEGDAIVPLRDALLPGAETYIYRSSEHQHDPSYYNSHVYLPNTPFAKRIIRKKIAEILKTR